MLKGWQIENLLFLSFLRYPFWSNLSVLICFIRLELRKCSIYGMMNKTCEQPATEILFLFIQIVKRCFSEIFTMHSQFMKLIVPRQLWFEIIKTGLINYQSDYKNRDFDLLGAFAHETINCNFLFMQLHVIIFSFFLAPVLIWCLEWRNTVEILRQNHIDHFCTKISWFLIELWIAASKMSNKVCGILSIFITFHLKRKNWPYFSLFALEFLVSKTCCIALVRFAIVIKNYIVLLKSANDDEKSLIYFDIWPSLNNEFQ